MNKLIITIAPTGNVPTKELTPYACLTNDEIINELVLCEKEGASIAHMHVRDNELHPTSDVKIFDDLLSKYKSKNIKMISQLSTGARGGENTIEYRSQMLKLNPEMASLSTGSSNFPTSINANTPDLIIALAKEMLDRNIKPEIEVFDLAMIHYAKYLVKKGYLKTPLHFNLVMNVPGSLPGTPKMLMTLIDNLPEGSTYTVSGIGKSQITMLTMAIAMGGHVRTGLEDLISIDGELIKNHELVRKIANIAKAVGRDIATPEEAREILSIR